MLCAIIPLTDYMNCTCLLEERIRIDEVNASWNECSKVNIGAVKPRQSEECLRQRCVSCVVVSVLM